MSSDSTESSNYDLTNRMVGDYRVLRRLGRGGMADVYLAEQQSLKRNVALKVLKPDLAKDQSYLARFRREAQAAAALVQSNIVQIYEVGESDGIHFIAQEYVPGRNLKQFIGRFGAVEPLMALNVLRQVTLALQKAHENGVIHRDIKPENIMLSTSGEIKVTDFGLARLTNNTSDSQNGLTQIGITMGTPLYMSPEQAEGRHLDTRSDIYSLGATLYHILAGKPPFEADNPIAIAVKQVKEVAENLHSLRQDVPDELNSLVHDMMAKKADDRPATPSELLARAKQIRMDDDQDWNSLAEKLIQDDSDTAPLNPNYTESKLAVTRQLQTVMSGNVASWWSSRSTWIAIFSLLLAAGSIGAASALLNPPANLLAKRQLEASSLIEKQDSVKAQYQFAYSGHGDAESAWQAVLDHFPLDQASEDQQGQTEYYHQLAKERLAEVYLEQREYEKAKKIYLNFIDYEGIMERVNANGHAGLAVLYRLSEQLAQSQTEIEKISSRELVSPYLNRRLRVSRGDRIPRRRRFSDAQ